MPYDHKIAGEVIKKLRRERGLSQEVLSGLAGIGRSHLAMIENGAKNANADTLWQIAEALGIKLSELIRMIEGRIEETGIREAQIREAGKCITAPAAGEEASAVGGNAGRASKKIQSDKPSADSGGWCE